MYPVLRYGRSNNEPRFWSCRASGFSSAGSCYQDCNILKEDGKSWGRLWSQGALAKHLSLPVHCWKLPLEQKWRLTGCRGRYNLRHIQAIYGKNIRPRRIRLLLTPAICSRPISSAGKFRRLAPANDGTRMPEMVGRWPEEEVEKRRAGPEIRRIRS